MASFQPSRRDCKVFLSIAACTFVAGLLFSCIVYSSAGPENSLVYLETSMRPAALPPQPASLLPPQQERTEALPVCLPAQDPADTQVLLPQPSDEALIAMLQIKDPSPAIAVEPAKEQWQKVSMRVTGYCACAKCCGKTDGITACNHHIQKGDVLIAADKHYAFGTEMIVPGYNNDKPAKVMDRGGAITGNRLDLFFHSHKEAQKWGVQYLDVLVKIG
ncbi:MAG: 3D domain-containing protein [Planctomycetaceae bacterium]|nr:3D domain-containing protein [Planctomycetaceae bacterium]